MLMTPKPRRPGGGWTVPWPQAMGAAGAACAAALAWWLLSGPSVSSLADAASGTLAAQDAHASEAVQSAPTLPDSFEGAATDAMPSVPAQAHPQMRPLRPRAGEMLASDLMAAYALPHESLETRYTGQRLRLLGAVLAVEQAPSGMSLVSLETQDPLKPLRALLAADALVDASEPVGQALVLDCLHRGVVMGEPVLSDCRLMRRE